MPKTGQTQIRKPPIKLSKPLVDALRAGDREAVYWDKALPGFGVRLFPSGKRGYIVQYRAGGRTRRMALGAHGVLTTGEARRLARAALVAVRRGEDPAAERAAARAAPTMAELCKRYLTDYAEGRKKASSLRNDRGAIECHVKPALGSHRVLDVTQADVEALHNKLRKTPYQANRVLALLSKLFNLAEQWDLRPSYSNPCRHVRRFREHKRERFLSVAELARLGAALARAERDGTLRAQNEDGSQGEPHAVGSAAIRAIRLLMFTGARLSEILTLRREFVDLEHGCLRLPDSKTGAKIVYLNAPALEVIAAALREGGDWIVPGTRADCPLVNLTKPWRLIRQVAGLDGVRIHDLRHSFASMGAGAGLGLPVIGALLGHTDASTTQRYSHLANDPVRQGAEIIGKRLAAAMAGGGKGADVVRLPG